MVKRIVTTNIHLRKLISKLRKLKKPIWRKVAEDLERPRRIRRCVNLSRINRYTEDGDVIVVPGKVLGTGKLDHKVIVGAWQFSEAAKRKIEEAGGKALSLEEFITKYDGKGVKIIG